MEKKPLVLKFKESDREFLFENKIFVIEDKKLIQNLEKPSIKNQDSQLEIKSLNNLHISDVIQVKVNMSDTGYFLVSFEKDKLSEEKRIVLLEEIGKLKSKAVQTNSTQLKKTKELLGILNKFKPIYAIFKNNGAFIINLTKLSQLELNFPLLVLKNSKKEGYFWSKKSGKSTPKNTNDRRIYSPIILFSPDYFFIFLFSLLGAFGFTSGMFEAMNKQGLAIFLFILGAAFVVVLNLAMQSTIYKKNKLRSPGLRYYLCLFILIGIAGGIVGGYFVSKFVFKTEKLNFNYKKMLMYSSIISLVALLSSVYTSILVNTILQKRSKSKN